MSTKESEHGITLVASVNTYTGYGQHAIEMARYLQKVGLNPRIRSIKTTEPWNSRVPDDISQMLVSGDQPGDWELLLSPLTMLPNPSRRTVYYTMWESSRLHRKGVAFCNKADAVVVPCQWCADIFSASGVDKPLYVVPLGINPGLFKKRTMPGGRVFTFGCGGWSENGKSRKGLESIIGWFQKAFPDNPNVRLLVKTLPSRSMISIPADRRIVLTNEYLDDRDMANWFAGVHCFVSAGVGGWELLAHQAMACGRPVISALYGGITEYYDESVGLVCGHEMVPARDSWTGCGHWVQMKDGAAIAAMQWAASHPAEVVALGEKASERAMRYTWEASFEQLVATLQTIGVLGGTPRTMPRKASKKCIVQLGRCGDVINILPVARDLAMKHGKVSMLVSKEYASVLDGVSYVQPIVTNEPFHRPLHAAKALPPGHDLLFSQVYGEGLKFVRKQESFNRESWDRIGYGKMWASDSLRLEFDRRDYGREYALAKPIFETELSAPHVPVILTHSFGNSSPFNDPDFFIRLTDMVGTVRRVDLDHVKADRVYDLLALMDSADALVAIDSAILHLAAASWIPTAALITDRPTLWHGTDPRCRIVSVTRYNESCGQLEAIAERIRGALMRPKILHVTNAYAPKNPDTIRREAIARRTWASLYLEPGTRFRPLPCYFSGQQRDGRSVGDHLDVPFIKDVIEYAVTRAGEQDIIAFSNTDTCLLPEVEHEILENVKKFGCYYSHRIDFPRIDSPMTFRDIAGRPVYPGADLFAFSVDWWHQKKEQLPDLLMGREGWDFIMKVVMRQSGFTPGQPMVYHESHESEWIVRIDGPGQKWNRKLCLEWANKYGHQQYVLKNSRFLFKAI